MDEKQFEAALEPAIGAYLALRDRFPDRFSRPGDAAQGEIELLEDVQDIRQACRGYAVWLRGKGLGPEQALPGLIYEDPWLMLLRDPVRFPGGGTGMYFRVLHRNRGGVGILPHDGERILLLRHFRHAPRLAVWEIPRGFSDADNADPEEDVMRELQEEIGTLPLEIRALGAFHADTGIQENLSYLYAARIEKTGALEASAGILEARWFTLPEFASLLRNGEMTDSFTEAAVLRALLHGILPGSLSTL